jgi:hypothetical protein
VPQSEEAAREFRDVGVAPLAMGGMSGGRMVAGERVEPLLVDARTGVPLDPRRTRAVYARGDVTGRPPRRAGAPPT